MSSDAQDPDRQEPAELEDVTKSADNPAGNQPSGETPAGETPPDPTPSGQTPPAKPAPPRIRIGSQRAGAPIVKANPHGAPLVRPNPMGSPSQPQVAKAEAETPDATSMVADGESRLLDANKGRESQPGAQLESLPDDRTRPAAPSGQGPAGQKPGGQGQKAPGGGPKRQSPPPPPAPVGHVPVPNRRAELPPEWQQELEEAMGELSMEDAFEPGRIAAPKEFEPDTRHQGRIVAIHRDNVFFDIGGRAQGIVPLKNFSEPPEVGAVMDVAVLRFDAEEGLYQLSLRGGAVDVGDWSQLEQGMLVEARITGHNKGGLECEVAKIRGFIPAGQVSVYRVEDLSQFVGEKMVCLVTEANPDRRNLVLSRRAVLEREKAEAKEKLMAELAEGQVREGVVRSLQDYGAFIDLGGVDGLLHVSQLSWQRVKHPSEVLEVGQPIKVKIRKIDHDTGKISLAFRDLTENPWTDAGAKYPVSSKVTGKVSRIMDFGAFVQLEPGVEGMVHISELGHGRVWRVSDVLAEGQEVEAKVLSVDPEQQRISLSIKAVMARPETAKKKDEPEMPEEEEETRPIQKRNTPLKGGTNRSSGGEQFGLKW